MARGKENTSSKTYLRIYAGKVVEKFKDGMPGGTDFRNPKDPSKGIYGQVDDFIEGVIANIYTTNEEHGSQKWSNINIEMYDPDDREVYTLSMGFRSNYARCLYQRLKAINFQEKVKISPYYFEADDEKNGGTKWLSGLNVFQNDGGGWEKIPPQHTKDNPNGLPPAVQKELNNETVWDFGDQFAFWLAMLNNEVLPVLPGGAAGQKKVTDPAVKLNWEEILGGEIQKVSTRLVEDEVKPEVKASIEAQNVTGHDEGGGFVPDDEEDDLPF